MRTEQQLDLGFSSTPCASSNGPIPDGPSSKTCPDCSAATPAKTLQTWLEHYVGQRSMYLETGGEMPALQQARKDLSNGLCWTRNMCEWNRILAPCLKDEGVSCLSEILETGPVDRRYYLSRKACIGILRRAERRGKELPPALRAALEQVAGSAPTTKSFFPQKVTT